MKMLAAFVLVGVVAGGYFARAADTTTPARAPILVELFTSEGCSSCPPADAFLGKLDATQPIPGAQLIVLSEHVDYWDHDGWRDPHSSPQFTERQTAYCQALRVSEPYTPQMIVDGGALLKITDPQQMGQVFQKAAAAPKIPVTISSVSVDGKTLRGHVQAQGAAEKADADVYVAMALEHAESQVQRGENQGRHLTHTAVVESLKKIGKLPAGGSFDQDFQLKIKSTADPANLRVVAFVQQAAEGKVLGAALQKPPLP
ncbi:MAG TPA: DUF1223 domain-containing protein [Bryobacteraceae bacterium]|nr:DUF1223 domain-containing protein [Bryobacteraceae bacterium]